MKRTLIVLLLGLICSLAGSGCGGDTRKGIYTMKDMPKPAEK